MQKLSPKFEQIPEQCKMMCLATLSAFPGNVGVVPREQLQVLSPVIMLSHRDSPIPLGGALPPNVLARAE